MAISLPQSLEKTPQKKLEEELTPQQIVSELDKYIVGQKAAKRAVAVALRNRYRRRKLPPELADVERHSWRNWFLLVVVLLVATVALITALPPLLSERQVNPWPWVKTTCEISSASLSTLPKYGKIASFGEAAVPASIKVMVSPSIAATPVK